MLTFFDCFDHHLPIAECYRMIRQAGFDGVTIWWSKTLGRDDYRDGPTLAHKTGLFIDNIHAPTDITTGLWLDNIEGDAVTGRLLHCVKDCAEFEIPAMVVHLPDEKNPPLNELGLDRIKRVMEQAERWDINVALENLMYNIESLAFVLDRIDSPLLGFCYDSGHQNCYTPSEDLLTRFSDRLMVLHLHDNDGSGDQHLLPFDGTIDWPATMKAIARAGYSGEIGLELMNWSYQDLSAEEFLRIAFERGKQLEALFLA